jgi:hypothetical protein
METIDSRIFHPKWELLHSAFITDEYQGVF